MQQRVESITIPRPFDEESARRKAGSARLFESTTFSIIGRSTLDLDKTCDFYQRILEFEPIASETLETEEGTRTRHIVFDIGRSQLIALWNQIKFQKCPQNMIMNPMFRSPFIILPSRPNRPPH